MKRYKVFENNGGGITLVVFDDNGNVEYLHKGYEYIPGELVKDLKALEQGANPKDEWDGNDNTPQETYNKLVEYVNDVKDIEIVADNDGIYPDLMGCAAREEFGIDV